MIKYINSLFTLLFVLSSFVKANIKHFTAAFYESLLSIGDAPTIARGVEKASIDEATIAWMNTVTTSGDTSSQVTALYSDDAVLWGTVSEDVRFTHKDIQNYFDYFANIPGLTVKNGSFKSVVQILGKRRNIAISSGYYEFIKPDKHGGVTSIPARFTFVYKKKKYSNDWEIINHHSSVIPNQPGILEPVCNKIKNIKFKELESYQTHLREREKYCERVKEYKKK